MEEGKWKKEKEGREGGRKGMGREGGWEGGTPVLLSLSSSLLLVLVEGDVCLHGGEEKRKSSLHLGRKNSKDQLCYTMCTPFPPH